MFSGKSTTGPSIRLDVIWSLAFFLLVFVGLSPFSSRDGSSLDVEGSGNLVRQALFIIVSSGIAYSYLRKNGSIFLKAIPLSTAFVLIWVACSILWSPSPDLTLRRSVFVILVTASSFAIVDMLGVESALRLLRNLLAWVIVIDLLSIPIIPGATHSYEGLQAWAGMHGHKNNAGTVATFAAMLFFHFAWHGRRWQDMALFLLAVIFLVGTISKTSMAMLVLLIFAFIAYRIAECNVYRRALFKFSCAILACVVIGVYFKYQDELLRFMDDPDLLTGRGYIWKVVSYYLRDHLWLGAGYGAFWQGVNAPALPYMQADWARGIDHAHSSYFDLLANTGLVGLILAIYAFVIAPFGHTLKFRVNGKAGALAFAWLLFGVVGGVTKTLFLYGASPEWVSIALMIAVAHHSGASRKARARLHHSISSKRRQAVLAPEQPAPSPTGL